jgi:NifU-like protein involved in Fe-S cluster formation
MADAPDLISLYSKRILALASDVPHAERLSGPQGSATKRSPLCGSTVTVDVSMARGRIVDFGQDVKACALGQASAAILGEKAVGASRAQIVEGRDALHSMLKQGTDAPEGMWSGLEVLTPARDYKNRHASIMLAWDGALAAMDAIEAPVLADGSA